MAMSYSNSGSINGSGYYRVGLDLQIASQDGDSAVIKGWGGAQLYNYTGHMNSAIIMPKIGTDYSYSGNIYANLDWNNTLQWFNTNQWWSSSNKYTVGTVNKTHSSQTKSFTAKLNIGGAGTVSVTKSITVPAKTSYTVAYNKNGGSSASANQTKWYGENLTLKGTASRNNASSTYTITLVNNNGTANTTKTQTNTTTYTFKNWNTASNGSGTSYSNGSTYKSNANLTLYAQWNYSTTYGKVTLTKPSTTPSGKVFKGWSTTNGGAVVYAANAEVSVRSNTTYYAVWGPSQVSNIIVINRANEELVPTWEQLINDQNSEIKSLGGTWGMRPVNGRNVVFYNERSVKLLINGNDTQVYGDEKPIPGGNYHT